MKKSGALLLFLLLTELLFAAPAEQTTLMIPPFKHSMGYYKANNSIARMMLGKRVEFYRTGGMFAVKLDELDDKTTRNDDAILSVFGINNHQVVYNVGLNKLKAYGFKGKGESPESLFYPTDVYADKSGLVYVTDTYNFRLLKFRFENDTLVFIAQKGGYGYDSTSFNLPSCIDCDAEGNIYVTDTGNDRIVVLDSLMNTIRILDDIERPFGIAVVDSRKKYLTLKDEKFIVVASSGRNLLKLTPRGEVRAEIFPQDITGYKDVNFDFIDYDYNGNIWVTDTLNSCVHKFSSDLRYITSFGREGRGKKQFVKPAAITINRKFGQVFIGEKTGFQYYWIGVDGWIKSLTPPVIDDSTAGVTIALHTTEQCKVNIEITHGGKIVRKLTQTFKREIGTSYIVWDLRDDEGNEIKDKGVYRISVSLEALYSTRGFFKKEISASIEKI